MLAELEWKTPHKRPGGKTVAEWVETVRGLERTGWLKEPVELPEGHPQLANRRYNDVLCLSLCWRPRCKRVGHCRYRLPLAVREWQPEYQAYFAIMGGKVDYPNVEIDEAKLEALARRIRFLEVPEEKDSSATGAQVRSG